MALSPGTRLGVYHVVAPLGAGGMGEVYRARDTKLDRDVALKILPESFASDPDRVMRFEREAKTLASLNHPHIAQIHGFEHSAGTHALVMELVEGEDLAERIVRGPLLTDEALPIARQIAAALEAAHDAGVIHRDLKPANVKVRADGTVKVLDFGLAKPGTTGPTGPTGATGATVTSPAMTMQGMILGTAAYMSPEQAKGKPVDRRSDIWAFGCVLYEMLTGRVPFGGESVVETLGEVLKSTPDWTELPPSTPPAIERLVRRCLVKEPSLRLQHIGDARLEIHEAESSIVTAVRSVPASRRWQVAAAAAVVVAMASVAAALYFATARGSVDDGVVKRFTISAPEGSDAVYFLAVSPSGRQIAIFARTAGGFGIFVRPLGSVEAQFVTKVTQPNSGFWSPDEQSLGYFDGGVLKIINLVTRETRIIGDAEAPHGGTWGADDTILFAPNATSGIVAVNARGGPITAVTAVDAKGGEESHRYPQFLPDGRRFVFLSWNSRKTAGRTKFTVQLGNLNASTSTMLVESSSAAWVDPRGYLLFAIDGPPRLVAAKFDIRAGQVIGSPITIAEDFEYSWLFGDFPAGSSRDGTLIYLNRRHRESTLTWFDRAGRAGSTLGERGLYFDPALSPDERTLLVERGDPNTNVGDLLRIDVATGSVTRATLDPGFDNVGLWSPDGQRILFSSDRGGLSHLYQMSADGSGEPTKVFGQPGMLAFAMDWSADGRSVLFVSPDRARIPKLWVLSLTPEPQARELNISRGLVRNASFSPDGRWIAYASDESGSLEVHVRAWPSLASPQRVSSQGGLQPRWRGDGKELFYAGLDGAIMSAPVSETAGTLRIGTPAMLFAAGLDGLEGFRNRFTVTADGQRFLVLKPVVDRRTSPITAIVNWTELVSSPR